MKMLDKAAVSYQIVLTKIDKLNEQSLQKTIASVENQMKKFIACHPQLLCTSAEKKIGLTPVRLSLYDLFNGES